MLYVRAANQPSMHILREWSPRSQRSGANPAQRGRAAFSQHCEVCHGLPEAGTIKSLDRSSVISLNEIGRERFAAVVRSGQAQMPGFSEDAISDFDLRNIATYIMNPESAGGEEAEAPARERRPDPELPPMPEGMVRLTARLGAMIYADNGLSAMRPPWAEIVAYDLNEGTIKWRAPLGTVPELVKLGIKNTGNNARLHRAGPVVTAGGLIFIGTWADRHVRAYDKDTGDILWEQDLEANPASIPAVFETGGRQYVAFFASSADTPREGNISFAAGRPDAQGYHIFALPEKAAAPGK
jgi:quinoprotein glucose dehydrogenase